MPGGSPNKWIRVAEDLRDRIVSGEFPDGTPLPIGSDLCREYKIGRSTLDKVRAFLREEGLLRTGQSVRPEPCVTSHCTPDRCIVTYKANKETQPMDEYTPMAMIVTGDAEHWEDSNEFTWAGFLIDGEMKWVQNFDCLSEVEHFPGHKPLIICMAAEFDGGTKPTPEIVVPVRAELEA